MDWTALKAQIRRTNLVPRSWNEYEFNIFLEVEAVLTCVERLACGISARNAWMIVSGYIMEGVNNTPEHRRMCLRLRSQLKYVKTVNAWHVWLHWYKQQPESIRLYRFSDDDQIERIQEAVLRSDRLEVYNFFILGVSEARSFQPSYASAGERYTFSADGMMHSLIIPDGWTQFTSTSEDPKTIPQRNWREPLAIDLATLLKTAAEIDALESEAGIEKKGDWEKRLRKLAFGHHSHQNEFASPQQIILDGLFHLAGALGIGKSTLIWVLTYHMARHNQHVTVVMNTVVEAINFAVWLRRLGIKAAPALGRNRAGHALKYGLAHEAHLRIEHVFQGDTPSDPALAWFPSPCAVRGLVTSSIPLGEEPCRRLEGPDGKRHWCPLISVCPTHKVSRDLVESQVWVLNPMSFLYSSAPMGISNDQLSLFEAVYRISDLVIIDEADRVQVQWDRAFAPTQPIAGSPEALLDILRRKIVDFNTGTRRPRSQTASFDRLTKLDNQANLLANRAFHLISSTPHLRAWIKNWQVTNSRLFFLLIDALMRSRKMAEEKKQALRDQLETVFRAFWRQPMGDQNELALWVKNLLGSDARDTKLRRTLSGWLAAQMKWNQVGRKRRRLVRRLELALVLATLMKHINTLFSQIEWIEDQVGHLESGVVELRESLVMLVPDPPMGDMLGLRFLDGASANRLGVFTAMRHRGVGRWLLHNLDDLYLDQEGLIGPHVLLTSATSWMPKSAQFHLAQEPHAVLMHRDGSQPQNAVHLEFRPLMVEGIKVQVSGAGQYRDRNLQQITRQIGADQGASPSDLQAELNFWAAQGQPRRILLVVNSYEQARLVFETLSQIPVWHHRVMRLIPDDDEQTHESVIRTRQVERLHRHNRADVLIVPLMAIQRGFNILDEADGALLGTAIFLVRPVAPPDDLSAQLLSLNAWWIQQIKDQSRVLPGLQALSDLRRDALKGWNRRLSNTNRGPDRLDRDLYQEFLRDQFISIWQTVGRLLRGGRNARVIFMDGAFGSPIGKRHMLRDWYIMLEELVKDESHTGLAQALYGGAYQAFHEAFITGRIV